MALFGALAEADRQGKEVFVKEVAVTASVAVTTPFATIDGVQITQKRATAPGLNSSVYTWDYTGGVLTIYAWKPTSATDPTLIAGTVASTVTVTVIGRRRQ